MQSEKHWDLPTVNDMIKTAIPLAASAQAEVLEFSRGHIKMKMPFKPNKNHVGTMYAGAIFTLAEIPGGAVLISAFDMQTYFPTLAKIETKFVAPARSDVTVECTMSDEQLDKIETEACEKGKSSFILELDIKDEKGVVVAKTIGYY